NLFIDKKEDADKLKQNAWLERIAQGHVNGLVKVFGLKKKSTSKPQPQPSSSDTYTVKKGDTLWAISRKYGMTVDELKKLNGLKSDLIHPGQKLKVKSNATPKTTDLKVGQKVKVKK